MLARLTRRLTYANVVSTLALFFALSTGAVYAANEWTGANIVDGSLTYLDIAPDSLGSGRIKDESLQAVDLAGFSVGNSEIVDGAVTGPKIDRDAVGPDEIATNAVGGLEIAPDSINGDEIQDNSIGAAELQPNSVGSSEIRTEAVGTSELAIASVNGSKIINGTVLAVDLKGGEYDGTISLSAGNIAAGRCRNFEVTTVGGADVGEVVLVSVKAPVAQGMLFTGVRVRAHAAVIFAVCNFTGGPHPAITNLPFRVMTFG
jgi:hypothetical protein